MAKSNSFFSIRRGSTKSHTYSGWQGQQVTKDRVITVKNPRSAAQQNQRQKFAAVGNFYKYLKFILNHSWEGVSYGVNSYNKFMSLNVKNFDADSMIIPEYGSKVAEAGTYQVSEGSLPTPASLDDGVEGFAIALNGAHAGEGTTVTAKDVKDAWFANADYITIVGLLSTVEPDGTPNVNYQTRGFALRLHKPSVADTTEVTDANLLTVLSPEAINLEDGEYEAKVQNGRFAVQMGTEAGETPTIATDVYVQSATVIASKADNGGSATLRSTAILANTSAMQELVASTNANNAESWPVGADYLLNGETVTPTAG